MILDLCLYYYVLLREAIENHEQRYLIKDFQTSHIQKESLFGVNHVLVSTSLCWGGVLVEGCVDRWPRPYFFVMYLSLPLSFVCSLSLVFSSLCPLSYGCLTVILDSNTCRGNGCFFLLQSDACGDARRYPDPKMLRVAQKALSWGIHHPFITPGGGGFGEAADSIGVKTGSRGEGSKSWMERRKNPGSLGSDIFIYIYV